jgi:hypothetical protein
MVQQIEVWLIVAGTLVLLAASAFHYRATLARRPLALGAALGIIPGILGALIVLVPRTDLIPDQVEPGLWIGLTLLVSGMFLTAIWMGAMRR